MTDKTLDEGGADVREINRVLDLYAEVCVIGEALVKLRRGERLTHLPEATWDGWADIFINKMDGRLAEIRALDPSKMPRGAE